MSGHVVVVGAGFAGTAAAFAASRAGARVTLVHDRAGTSELYSGALDLSPWDALPDAEAERAALADAALRDFRSELGAWALGQRHVATRGGVVRRALGADAALLDLTPVAGRRVGVADIGREDWDAPELAASLSASDWAERTRTSFVAVAVKALRAGHERRITPYDFATVHDDPERLRGLARALGESGSGIDGWLLGPWLGLEPATAPALRALVPVPIGESTSPMGGPAGARFERARARLLASLPVQDRPGRVRDVSRRGSGWSLALETDLDDPVTSHAEIEASAVVLATGGVAAGGIRLGWEPGHGARGFELGYDAPVLLALDREFLASAGSMFGPDLEHAGLSVLERVGVATTPERDAAGDAGKGLLVAGDAVAGRPRTVLGAVLDGLRAGARAARLHEP